MARIIRDAKKKVVELSDLMSEKTFFGYVEGQTIDSIFVDLLPQKRRHGAVQTKSGRPAGYEGATPLSIGGRIAEILCEFTSLTVQDADLNLFFNHAMKHLSDEDTRTLKVMMKNADQFHEKIEDDPCSASASDKLRSLPTVVEKVIQMYLTWVAASRLFLLATPEAIFANR